MYYNRIDPKTGLVRIFSDLEDRIAGVETAPSGSIGVTDQLIISDPDSNEEIIIGRMPNGEYDIGINPNDTDPPGTPTTPVVKAALGAITVSYDGLMAGGSAQPMDYDRTEIEYSSNGTLWLPAGSFTRASTQLIPDLEPGTTYQVRLKSIDRNGNVSGPSGTVSATPTRLVDSPDIVGAISELQERDTAIQTTLDGKVTVSEFAPTAGDLPGKPKNALWTQMVAGVQVGAWYKPDVNSTQWSPMPFSPTLIPQIQIGTGTFGELDGIRIKTNTLTSNQILITDYQNLIDNGRFNKTPALVGWTAESGTWFEDTFAGVPSGRGMAINVDATVRTIKQDRKIDVAPLEKFRLSFFAKRVGGISANFSVNMRFTDSNNNALPDGSSVYVPTVEASAAPYLVQAVFTSPENAAYAYVTVNTIAQTGTYFVLSEMELFRMNAGKLIVDGEITSSKIDTDEFFASTAVIDKITSRVATFLTNADGTGYTSVVNGEGLRIFYTDPETGEQQNRISLGTFNGTADYLGLTDDSNELSVSINKDGAISGRVLDIRDNIMLKGDDLDKRLYDMPQSLVAWGQIPINTSMSSNAEVGLFEIGWESDQTAPGRMYQLQINPFLVSTTAANGTVGLRVRYTTNGSIPTITSQLIGFNYIAATAGLVTLDFSRIIGSTNGPYMRVLVSLYDTSSGVATVYEGIGQTHLFCTVTDMGVTLPHSASVSTGGGTPYVPATEPAAPTYTAPPAPKVTKTVEWGSTGRRSYIGSGATYAYNTTKGYQGLSPAGYGNLKSIWTFPSLTSTLSGSTINDIWAYFYFEHWYNNAGGTARIRLHNNASLPATYNGNSNGVNSAAWPKAAGRWVRLPSSLYAGFQSGIYKGLALEGDGTYNTYGIANNCRLRIKYTK